jgi:hypothetical protein
VLWIRDFIQPPGIVKDGEEPYNLDVGAPDFSQTQSVLQHSRPMPNAMITVQRPRVLAKDRFEDAWNVERHLNSRSGTGDLARVHFSSQMISRLIPSQQPMTIG